MRGVLKRGLYTSLDLLGMKDSCGESYNSWQEWYISRQFSGNQVALMDMENREEKKSLYRKYKCQKDVWTGQCGVVLGITKAQQSFLFPFPLSMLPAGWKKKKKKLGSKAWSILSRLLRDPLLMDAAGGMWESSRQSLEGNFWLLPSRVSIPKGIWGWKWF